MRLPKTLPLQNVQSLQRLQLIGLGINTDLHIILTYSYLDCTFTKVSTNFGSVTLISVGAIVRTSEHCLSTGLFNPTEDVSVQVYPQPISDRWMLGAADEHTVSSPFLSVSGQCAVYLLNWAAKKRWWSVDGMQSVLVLTAHLPSDTGQCREDRS